MIREKDILRVSVLKGMWYYCTNRQIDQLDRKPQTHV